MLSRHREPRNRLIAVWEGREAGQDLSLMGPKTGVRMPHEQVGGCKPLSCCRNKIQVMVRVPPTAFISPPFVSISSSYKRSNSQLCAPSDQHSGSGQCNLIRQMLLTWPSTLGLEFALVRYEHHAKCPILSVPGPISIPEGHIAHGEVLFLHRSTASWR